MDPWYIRVTLNVPELSIKADLVGGKFMSVIATTTRYCSSLEALLIACCSVETFCAPAYHSSGTHKRYFHGRAHEISKYVCCINKNDKIFDIVTLDELTPVYQAYLFLSDL